MGFEPQKFFIGVIDLFAVILPGALITFLLADSVGPSLLGSSRYEHLHGAERGLAFAFASYLAGHFIFLVSAFALDEHLYDRIRRATPLSERRRLANGGSPSSWLARLLARITAAHTSDEAVRKAELLRDADFGRIGADKTINAFQWSKARLTLEHADALTVVQRFEADSKFFRSLTLVLPVAAIWGAVTGHFVIVVSCVPLTVAAFLRYVDQRVKATRQAYWFMIAIAAQQSSKGDLKPEPTTPDGDAYTHAGGVVYRTAHNGPAGAGREVLLVRAKTPGEQWVLPKGHIEPHERSAESAVREVAEEAGVLARVVRQLGDISMTTSEGRGRAAIYLMEFASNRGSPESGRNPTWLAPEKAITEATFGETRELIQQAVRLLGPASADSEVGT